MGITVHLEKLTDEHGWVGSDIELPVEEDFEIDDNNIDGELCKAGRLLVYYGDLMSEMKAQAVRKKNDLELHAANLAIDIRKEAANTKTKVTEGGIKEKIITNSAYQNRQAAYVDAEKEANKTESFYRSQKHKTDVVIALAYKQKTEIAKGAY